MKKNSNAKVIDIALWMNTEHNNHAIVANEIHVIAKTHDIILQWSCYDRYTCNPNHFTTVK